MRERLIDSIQIHLHDFLAFLCVGFANRVLDRIDRLLSAASTPEMAKKQVCITVLMRPPMPDSRATLLASITKKRACCSINRRCTFSGKCCQTFRIERRIEQERSRGQRGPEHIIGLEQERLMAADELRLT